MLTSWMRGFAWCGWLLLPGLAGAQFTCTTNDGSIIITGYTGTGGAVTIPDTIARYIVTSIGDYAFYDCTNLTSITIGINVTNVGVAPFDYCSSLTNITVAANNSNYASLDGVLFDQSKSTLIQYPDGLTGSYLIPASVTSIGKAAFGSSLLTRIIVPGTVTNIDDGAFAACASLTNAVISEGVINLGAEALSGTALTEITIPGSITAIGLSEFAGCRSLTKITVAPNNLTYSSVAGVLFNRSQSTIVGYPAGATGNYTIPASVNAIGDVAFLNSGITSLSIPGTVRTIGINAFGYCDELTNVMIANGVVDVGDLAFYECRQLAQVNIPLSVTNIGEFAFFDCESLLGVIVPGNVTSIGQSAFNLCINLSYVILTNGLQNIGSEAFADCSSLTNIVIPASVTKVGPGAFTYSTSLTGVYFKGSPPVVDSSAWSGDDNVVAYYLPTTTGWDDWSLNAGIPVTPWLPKISIGDGNWGEPSSPFGFNINWVAGQTLAVKACTNLAHPDWQPLQKLTLTNDAVSFSDPKWTNYRARFYSLALP